MTTKWISVDQELPPVGVMIIVVFAGRVTVGWKRSAYSSKRKVKEWYVNGIALDGVTHWMPLPAPPEGQ